MRQLNENDLIRKNFYDCTYYVGNNPNIHEGTFYYDECGYWSHEDNVMLIEVTDESILRVLKEKNHAKYKEITNS